MPDVNPGTDPEGEGAGSGASRFLSKRTRQAMDDVLRDPDVEQLTGRAKSFARERLLQAEAAARVLTEVKEEEEEGREKVKDKTSQSGDERRPGGSSSETPIISGLVSDASKFVAGRVEEAKKGVKVVVEAAVDERRARQQTAAAATEQSSEKDEADGDGGDAVGRAAKGAGEGDKRAGTR